MNLLEEKENKKEKAHLLLAVRFFKKIFIFDATKLD